MLALNDHWDALFGGSDDSSFGWYEPDPPTLVEIRTLVSPSASVIDVGAGSGRLADHLSADGFDDITLLDVSAEALRVATDRLGEERVTAVVGDVTRFRRDRTWDLWHDRAVFHFLVDEHDRVAYVAAARAAVRPGGFLVVATFAPEGPSSCAGLPVQRYDEHTLAVAFADGFECLGVRRHDPGPGDADRRPYVIGRFRRTG